MRRFLTYPAAGLLILTYLLSYIGFGVHTCSCSGSRQVILLFNNLSCEKIHAHIHILGTRDHHPGDGCGEHHDSDHECEACQGPDRKCAHDHQDGCCHTDIMVLTDVQDDSRQTGFINVAYRSPGFESQLADVVVPVGFSLVQNCHRAALFRSMSDSGIPFRNCDLLSAFSVWRI